MEKFFASSPRGLESLLVEDLTAVGVMDSQAIPGGVHFSAEWPACYAANLHSRIATRILWRVAHGRYAKEDDIYKLALDTAWPSWFAAGQTIRVDVTAVKSPLKINLYQNHDKSGESNRKTGYVQCGRHFKPPQHT